MTTSLAVIVGGRSKPRKLLTEGEIRLKRDAGIPGRRAKTRDQANWSECYFGASMGESRFSSCSRLIAS